MAVQEFETVPLRVRAFQYTTESWDEIYTLLDWPKTEEEAYFDEDPAESPDSFEVSVVLGGKLYEWVNRNDYVVMNEKREVLEVVTAEKFQAKYQRPTLVAIPYPG